MFTKMLLPANINCLQYLLVLWLQHQPHPATSTTIKQQDILELHMYRIIRTSRSICSSVLFNAFNWAHPHHPWLVGQASLIPRPSTPPVFDHLQYAKTAEKALACDPQDSLRYRFYIFTFPSIATEKLENQIKFHRRGRSYIPVKHNYSGPTSAVFFAPQEYWAFSHLSLSNPSWGHGF